MRTPHHRGLNGSMTESAGPAAPARDFAAWKAHLEQAWLRPAAERPASSGQGVHHLALICRDVEATIAFYQDMLGFPLVEVMENRDYVGSTHFFLDIGNGNLLAFFDFPGLASDPRSKRTQRAARRHLGVAGLARCGPRAARRAGIATSDPTAA